MLRGLHDSLSAPWCYTGVLGGGRIRTTTLKYYYRCRWNSRHANKANIHNCRSQFTLQANEIGYSRGCV